MRDYANEMCLLGLSAAILAIPAGDPFAITGFLAALIVTCANFARPSVRVATQVAYVACACFIDAFLTFLPVVAYGLMHDRHWPVRLLWLVPLAAWMVLSGAIPMGIQLVVLCLVACVLAANDGMMTSERRGLTHAYDSLRERMMASAKGSEDEEADTESERLTSLFEDLSPRESAVAQLVAEGLDNREISQRLFLSEGTVRNYISSILSKKGLANRTQIAVMYYTG